VVGISLLVGWKMDVIFILYVLKILYLLYRQYVTLLGTVPSSTLGTKDKLNEEEQRILWFQEQRLRRAQAIRRLLWDKHSHQWRDYDMKRSEWTRRKFDSAASNYLPLWSNAIESLVSSQEEAKAIVESFLNSGLLQVGGVLTTTFESGQQWDSPNAWPPLQVVIGEFVVLAFVILFL
jgi:neutral trehalase